MLENQRETIALIQEPWIRGDRICGLANIGGKLLLDTSVSKPRTCIFVPKHVNTLLINEFCSRDLTATRLSRAEQDLPDIVLASAYLPGDEDVPLPELALLVEYCEREKLELIIATDSNAHHTLWGNAKTNNRGEEMLDFILSNNLILLNKGSEPTFINARSQTIIDLTIATSGISNSILNWHVSNELSCSDHRWIRFTMHYNIPKPQPIRVPRNTDKSKFIRLVNTELGKLDPLPAEITVTNLDDHVNNITSILLSSFEQSCPLTVPRQGVRRSWWGPDLERHRHRLRRLFNRAMNTRSLDDWDRYALTRRNYKKLIRLRGKNGWRRFCTNIENNNQALRVKNCLAQATDHSIGCLKKADNTYTKNDTETSELLLTTHFPGCQIAPERNWEPHRERATSSIDWEVASEVIDKDKIMWAINTFLPFKAAGMDGVFPALLRWSGDLLANYLVRVFQACLAHRYIPLKWREVKIMFIPKPGRGDYTQPKSFRPISLTSFFLKTLERLGDRKIRNQISILKPLHPNQHAYCAGKSTESALHSVVSRIGNALKTKNPTLGAFIDIEGAFDKTNFSSINQALAEHGVAPTLIEWINNMLKYRAIQFTVNTTTRGIVSRGCPQGGVLSPLLWILVANELITELNACGLYSVGYADDIAILISGKFEGILCDLMRKAFRIIEKWCAKHELSVNPSKTELIMFTNKRVLGPHILPKLFNSELTLKEEVKYLGVVLDSKLLWNKHLDHKLNKCTIAFYQCKKMIGNKWGLSPKITLWLYTAVIRPMLAYGALVWWTRTELSTTANKLQRFQRLACSAITGCMKTTPTAAMEIALQLTPLDLYIQQEATLAAIRLMHLGIWGKNHSSPHTNILDRAIECQPLIAAPCDRTLNKPMFNKKYNIQTIEEERDQSGAHEVRIYTDGSKTQSGSGAGVHSLDLNINFHISLGAHSSIFQCECVALTEAAITVRRLGIHDYGIRFLSDSLAVLKALDNKQTNNKLIFECHLALESISTSNRITLQWIKGHSGSLGNDAADELAKRGSEMVVLGPYPLLPIAFSLFRSWIRQRSTELQNNKWSRATDCRQSKMAIPKVHPRLTKRLLSLNRYNLRIMIGTITGHCPLNKHLFNTGATDSPLCRGCFSAEETVAHVILDCDAVATQRDQILGTVRSLREACEVPRKLLCFWTELGWLR